MGGGSYQGGGVDPFDLFREAFGGNAGGGGIFEDLFGGGRSSGGAQAGADLRYDLEITLEEAAKGVEKRIRYRRHCTCSTCQGTGAEPGTGKTTCQSCQGTGQISTNRGFISFRQVCPDCSGTGSIIEKPCVANVAAKGGPLTKVRLRQKYLPAYTLDLGYALLETEKQEHTVAPLAIYTSLSS